MSNGTGASTPLVTPADIKTWVAALSSVGAGLIAFVQSERWEIALLVLAGFGSAVGLASFVLRRLRQVEHELGECRKSHAARDDRISAAHTAIAILHERARARGDSLPRLTDLLGSDAMGAILRADELRQTSSIQRDAEPEPAK